MKIVDISIPMPWGDISGRTYGEENNLPVLCLHGFNDNLEAFSNLIPLLPQNFYYVSIDLPGHGRSAHAEIGYILDLNWYILSVKRVIDHFRWSKIYLLGHSFGGHVCIFTSALYPELVLKLIIIDAHATSETPLPSFASVLKNNYLEPTLKFERLNPDDAPVYSLDSFVRKMKEVRLTEITVEQLTKIAERNLTKINHNQYKNSNDQRTKILGFRPQITLENFEDTVKDICCPILLILGKNSNVTRPENKNQRIILKVNKNVVIHIIDGDHDVHITRPNQVAELIVPFLTRETKSKL